MSSSTESSIRLALAAARGHYRYESGHHGDLWLDLDAQFVDARSARSWAAALAEQAAACRPDIVAGPLTGGAFVAQSIAAEIGAGFVFAERIVSGTGVVQYRVPKSLRGSLRGKRVLLVDDAINAGSAVQAASKDVSDCGAVLSGIAALMTLGDAAAEIARQQGVPLFSLVRLQRGMWTPEECPLCSSAVPLVDPLARS